MTDSPYRPLRDIFEYVKAGRLDLADVVRDSLANDTEPGDGSGPDVFIREGEPLPGMSLEELDECDNSLRRPEWERPRVRAHCAPMGPRGVRT